MSLLKANAVQLGQSLTATNNFTWYQPSSPDGTVRLGNGNSGSVTDLVTLTSAGNLGIGTSSPGYKLEVNSGSAAYSSKIRSTTTYSLVTIEDATTTVGAGPYLGALANNLVFGRAGVAEYMRLDSSGNLGLGVTPSGWGAAWKAYQYVGGSVASPNGNNNLILQNAYNNGTNYIYTYNGAASYYQQSAGNHVWNTAPSGTAGNAISFTQAMTLDASGNLLVGVTSSTATPAKGFVATSSGNAQIAVGHDTGALSGYYYASFAYNGSAIGSITQSGTTGVLYNITSDRRLKENIVDAPSALSSVNAIKVRSFNWKSDGSHVDYGYIAQELLDVVPEAVTAPEDPDEMMGVDFGKLTPRLVKAIQELSAQVSDLKTELNELKQKVNA